MDSWVIFAIGVISGIFMTALMVVASNASDLKSDELKIKDISDETIDEVIAIFDPFSDEIKWGPYIYQEKVNGTVYVLLKSKFRR
jgi:hypothetical protein